MNQEEIVNYMNKKEAIQLAQKYVNTIINHGVPIIEAKLFGSYTTGKADQWSDIDVCLVSSSFTNQFDSRVQLMHLKHDIDERIEPHPFTPEDFQSKWIPITSVIRENGIKLKIMS